MKESKKQNNSKNWFNASVSQYTKKVKWEREEYFIFSLITSFIKLPLYFSSLSHKNIE
jgi:hypothetical protein